MDKSCFNWRQLVLKSDLPPNSKYIALYLSTFMNEQHDMAWPSLRRIEHETGLTRKTVIKHIRIMEESGWLIASRSSQPVGTKGGWQAANCYITDVPDQAIKKIAQGGVAVTPPLAQGGVIDDRKVVEPVHHNNNLNNNININNTKPSKTLNKSEVEKLARPGETWPQTIARLKADGYGIHWIDYKPS